MILQTLEELPPDEWFNDCNTQDRIDSWNRWKHFYSIIHAFLKAHFSREELLVDTLCPDPDLKEMCGFYMDYCLALYAVISWGWKYIREKLEDEIEDFPSNPGEMFDLILQSEALGFLSSCVFPEYLASGNYYYEFSPRKTYNFYKKSSKVEQLRKSGKKLTKKDKILVQKHLEEISKKKLEIAHFYKWFNLCIQVCEKAKTKDKVLKNRLEELSRKSREIRNKILSMYHPRKAPPGHAINNGVRLPATKGAYLNVSLQS
ncbi:hypothetical protein NIES22_73750 (plasmid) [Calothrix brevissima NIES-22]|nr:hypothetical protein NIES22_73750 [Calothrix brevissima NIES-22]